MEPASEQAPIPPQTALTPRQTDVGTALAQSASSPSEHSGCARKKWWLWGVGALALVLLVVVGCPRRRTPPHPAMNPETAAAYKAVPVADAQREIAAWRTVATDAAVTKAVVARDNSGAARLLVPGAVELPCAFSKVRSDRACWDLLLPINLAEAEGLAFDFWCGDVTQFTGFSIYFKCGTGWRHTAFSPLKEREWHRVTIPKARVRMQEGKPTGWETVSAIRLCGWRGGTNDTELAVANLSFAAPPKTNTVEELAAEERQNLAWLKRLPTKKGEWRGFWCHAYYGLSGKSWAETIGLLKTNGFTAVVANLAWAGTAFYQSDVLPVAPQVATRGDQLAACLAACRAQGIECHVWNVCWNLGHHATKGLKDKLTKAKRTQVRFDGTVRSGWLCPSHPDNLAYEIRSFVELAKRGVDGVHLDYIRYPDESHCFCAGCKSRFASKYGLSLTNWPVQVRQDADIKALWREFRITNITALVRGVSAHVRREAPGVKISAAVFQNPETNPGAIGQDWADWCRKGYLDFVCPMDYNYESAVAFKGVVFSQKRHLAESTIPLRPGIGLSCWKDDRRYDARRVAEEILAVREAGLDGFCVFNLDARAIPVLPLLHIGPLK